MNHQEFAQLLGNYGEFLGAIGVIVTLVYLAVQIRDSAKATGIETERDLNEAWNVTMAEWGADERIADILARGFRSYRDLSQPEKAVFHARIGRVLNHHYTQNRMRSQGVGDPALADAIDNVAAMILKSPGGRQWWDDIGPSYAHYEDVLKLMEERSDARSMSELEFWKIDEH